MELFKHTNEWLKGEIFEGTMVLIFGVLLLIITFCFWKFGFSINSKAMIFPALIISLLHIGTGIYMTIQNKNRKTEYLELHTKDADSFKQSEIDRTEAFIKWYPTTRYISIGFIILGFCLFNFIPQPIWKSIGLCIMILGFSLITIDYFSEERAFIYHNALTNGK